MDGSPLSQFLDNDTVNFGRSQLLWCKGKMRAPILPPRKVKKRLHGVVLTKQPTFPRHFSGRYAKNERRSGLIKPNDRRERRATHIYVRPQGGRTGIRSAQPATAAGRWRAATRRMPAQDTHIGRSTPLGPMVMGATFRGFAALTRGYRVVRPLRGRQLRGMPVQMWHEDDTISRTWRHGTRPQGGRTIL